MTNNIEALKKLEIASFQAARLAAEAGKGDSYFALVMFTSLTRMARESAEIREYELAHEGKYESPVPPPTA